MKICFIIARKNSFINPLNTLKNYNNKTVIQLICENILASSNIDNLIVMTDCLNIQNKVKSFNVKCENYVNMPDDNLKCINNFFKLYETLSLNCNYIINIDISELFLKSIDISNCINNFIKLNTQNTNYKAGVLHHILDLENNIPIQQQIDDNNFINLYLKSNNDVMFMSRKGLINNKNIYNKLINFIIIEKNYFTNKLFNSNTFYQENENLTAIKILEDGFNIVSYKVDNYDYIL